MTVRQSTLCTAVLWWILLLCSKIVSLHACCYFSVCGSGRSGRYGVAAWALGFHIKGLFNGANVHWHCSRVWGRPMVISVSDWENWSQAAGITPSDISLRMKIRKGGELANNSRLSPGSPSTPAAFRYQPLAVFPTVLSFVFHLSSKACYRCFEPLFLKACGGVRLRAITVWF